MTEELKKFCDKLKMLLDSMRHREELILKSSSLFCGKVFNHEIKIEKVHNLSVPLPNTIPMLTLDHKVKDSSGRRKLIETYVYVNTLMLNTVYYYGKYSDGSFGMDISELEIMERARLCSEDSVVNFDELFEQMNLAAVKMI